MKPNPIKRYFRSKPLFNPVTRFRRAYGEAVSFDSDKSTRITHRTPGVLDKLTGGLWLRALQNSQTPENRPTAKTVALGLPYFPLNFITATVTTLLLWPIDLVRTPIYYALKPSLKHSLALREYLNADSQAQVNSPILAEGITLSDLENRSAELRLSSVIKNGSLVPKKLTLGIQSFQLKRSFSPFYIGSPDGIACDRPDSEPFLSSKKVCFSRISGSDGHRNIWNALQFLHSHGMSTHNHRILNLQLGDYEFLYRVNRPYKICVSQKQGYSSHKNNPCCSNNAELYQYSSDGNLIRVTEDLDLTCDNPPIVFNARRTPKCHNHFNSPCNINEITYPSLRGNFKPV